MKYEQKRYKRKVAIKNKREKEEEIYSDLKEYTRPKANTMKWKIKDPTKNELQWIIHGYL